MRLQLMFECAHDSDAIAHELGELSFANEDRDFVIRDARAFGARKLFSDPSASILSISWGSRHPTTDLNSFWVGVAIGLGVVRFPAAPSGV